MLLPVEEKRGRIDERPYDILSACEAFIFKLELALHAIGAELDELGIESDGEFGFRQCFAPLNDAGIGRDGHQRFAVGEATLVQLWVVFGPICGESGTVCISPGGWNLAQGVHNGLRVSDLHGGGSGGDPYAEACNREPAGTRLV